MVKIYKITSPLKPNEIYIGATTTTLNSRLSQHKWDANNKKNKKSKWLKELLDLGASVFIELIEEVNLEDYQSKEEFHINDSITKGLSIANFRLNSTGIILGRSEESIQRSCVAKYRPILQIDPFTKTVVREWDSAKSAADAFNCKTNSAITNALKGWTDMSNGFVWEYKDGTTSKIRKKKKTYEFVEIYNKLTEQKTVFSNGESPNYIVNSLGFNVNRYKLSSHLSANNVYETKEYKIVTIPFSNKDIV